MGGRSPVYAPVADGMIKPLGSAYPWLCESDVAEIIRIMTTDLTTETLLIVTILDMLDRFKSGERGAVGSYGQFGAGIQLSAVAKDGKSKVQTVVMKLLHDVVVELQMAQGNFTALQRYLDRVHGVQIVTLHSCGAYVVATADVVTFHSASGPDQALRTRLDWESSTPTMELPFVLAMARYTSEEAQTAQRCYDQALTVVQLVVPAAAYGFTPAIAG